MKADPFAFEANICLNRDFTGFSENFGIRIGNSQFYYSTGK